MLDVRLTNHAAVRMGQRGFREADVDLLLKVGTQIGDEAIFLTDRDAAREIERRRREIRQLERLRGSTLVVADGSLITLYHSDQKPFRNAKTRAGRNSQAPRNGSDRPSRRLRNGL